MLNNFISTHITASSASSVEIDLSEVSEEPVSASAAFDSQSVPTARDYGVGLVDKSIISS